MNMNACSLCMLPFFVFLPSARGQSPGTEKQALELVARLAADRVDARRSAARDLSALAPGPWVKTVLGMSASLKPDARRELADALGGNPALLEPLARALLDEVETARAAARALRRHLLLHIPPVPRNPDREILPRVPLNLRTVRDLLDLCDRLLVSGWFSLPLLVHPGLDQKGSWGRRPVEWPPGAPVLRELLPPFVGPGSARWERPITRVSTEGFLLTAGQLGESFADMFPENLRILLAGHEKASIADRAAINLGCLDLVSILPFLRRLAEGEDALGDRASLALAVAFVRGFEAPDPDRFAARLMRVYRGSSRPFRQETSSRRLFSGIALRRLLQRSGSSRPSWLGEDDCWRDAAIADLFAGIAPGPFRGDFAAALGDEGLAARVRASLLLSLSRAPGPGMRPELRTAVRNLLLERPPPDDGDGNRVLEAGLRLLGARGGKWVPDGLRELGDESLGRSYERGRIWARALARAGAEGVRISLGTLLHAKARHPAHLGLASFPGYGAFGGMREWLAVRGRAGTEHGQGLVDLLIGSITALRLKTEQDRKAALGCFGRLRARLITEQAGRVHDAIGEALGRLLLALPKGPENKSVAQWLVSWLVEPRTRRGGRAAARVCLADRESLLGDIQGELGKLKPLDRSLAVTLGSELRPLVGARPASLGWAPVDPMDPLLYLPPGEKR